MLKKYRAAVLVLALTAVAVACEPPPAPPATPLSNIVFDGSPGVNGPPPTLGGFAMTSFGLDPRPQPNVVGDVPGPTGAVQLAPNAEHRRVGPTWATWSHGYTGDVYLARGSKVLTLTLPPNADAFYLYVEPNVFEVVNVTAEAQDGTTSSAVPVNGSGGAKYFGFYGINGAKVESIKVTSTRDFAVGEFGITVPPRPSLRVRSITQLGDFRTSIGLRNSDDQGTQFDVRTELVKNGTQVVATGLTRCVTGVTRNPTYAKDVVVPWNSFAPVPVNTGDVFELRVSTRVGTAANDTKCAGPGGSHNNAVGLRLYYDAAPLRASRFDMTISPPASNQTLYLHSNGSGCGDTETPGVTSRTLNSTAPGMATAKCKDSGVVNFAGGNGYQVIGSWSMAPQA